MNIRKHREPMGEINDYLISLSPIEVQKNFIEVLKQDEKDKQSSKTFISNQNDKRVIILKDL